MKGLYINEPFKFVSIGIVGTMAIFTKMLSKIELLTKTIAMPIQAIVLRS